ncbi:iron-containing redox enzyme family protein [Oerskovia flava]|uniref:iron-containing redox enzyme family protein n=1 Tax=Oerskovia flava TaxID=2986422 RepID=UPI002AD1F5F4|nr:iron-containing redox enzyme family protein [Oerskovia sp. JB1-3-2]
MAQPDTGGTVRRTRPIVSLVIPTHDDDVALRRCLTSVAAQDRPPDEVLVVDHASHDGTNAVARAFGARVVHEPREGTWPAAATGYDCSTGDIITRCDADAVLPGGWVRRVLDAFETEPRTTAVTGPGRGGVDLFGFAVAMRRSAWLEVRGGSDAQAELYDDDDLSFRLGVAGRISHDAGLQAGPAVGALRSRAHGTTTTMGRRPAAAHSTPAPQPAANGSRARPGRRDMTVNDTTTGDTATDDPTSGTRGVHLPVPRARGPVSTTLLQVLAGPADSTSVSPLRDAVEQALGADPTASLCRDEDLQLTLTCLYELHYRGVEGADERWEWSPELLGVRASIEVAFEAALRREVEVSVPDTSDAEGMARHLFALAAADDGPSLAKHVARRADDDQLREVLALKSVYQLKEADPHSWAIPRLAGAPKAALVEIQTDEYGGGRAGRMHAELFAGSMRGMGLDDSYGAYLDLVPVEVLTAVNAMSMFGLHRRLRGAIVGHLAAFEMTSSLPSRLYGNGFRRLGHDEDTTRYFDEHVEADAVHEQIAGRDLAGRLAETEPGLVDDIVFGAAACLLLEGRVAGQALESWGRGESALRAPLAAA